MTNEALPSPKDKWIPFYFVMFFVVIAITDGIFVYTAINTHTGVVTDQAYEKGLAYNDILEKARSQPNLQQKPSFQNGVLRWDLKTPGGEPLTMAQVSATLFRPVQDGYDFDINLEHAGNGVYEATINAPLPGLWKAKLTSTWDNKTYQTTYQFVTD